MKVKGKGENSWHDIEDVREELSEFSGYRKAPEKGEFLKTLPEAADEPALYFGVTAPDLGDTAATVLAPMIQTQDGCF